MPRCAAVGRATDNDRKHAVRHTTSAHAVTGRAKRHGRAHGADQGRAQRRRDPSRPTNEALIWDEMGLILLGGHRGTGLERRGDL